MLREAVRLVAHVLQQPQGEGVSAQSDRFRLAGAVDQLFLLGERDHRRRLDAERLERLHPTRELALSPVDQQQVGAGLVGFFGYAAVDNFRNALADLANTPYEDMLGKYGLTVVPLFILMDLSPRMMFVRW